MTRVRLPQLLTGKDVMSELAEMLPRRGPTVAAVAYVTHDHLGFDSKDDVLVVNASRAAVRAGATDPTVLLKLLRRKVTVVSQPELHGKAIVRANVVAMGSANLSMRTLSLEELMWVTKDDVLLRRTRQWISELVQSGETLDPEHLRALSKEFAADASEGGSSKAGHEPSGPPLIDDPFAPSRVDRLWLWKSWPAPANTPMSPSDSTAVAETHPALNGTEWVLNSASASTRVGDVWIRYGYRLHPPRRVLVAQSADATRGEHWSRVSFRRGDESVAVPEWVRDKYREALDENDVLVTNERDKRRLLALWGGSS